MNTVREHDRRIARGFALAAVIMIAVEAGLFLGCTSTVAPKPARDNVASWDGDAQNSGFIGYLPGGSGVITSHAKARYDALCAAYGSRFLPPLAAGPGLAETATNTWVIDAEHLEKFMLMNRWRKNDPKNL